MQDAEIAWLGIDGLHGAIEKDETSAGEIVEAMLRRIEALDPRLQAYSVVWPERARQRAARLDADRSSSGPLRPLEAVPVALKDLCDVEGEPTRAGTVVLGDRPAARNAEVVDRLEAAGALILGKVKMTEGALTAHHPSITPPVNPWNPARWTGISSSGSGVAVAGGLATLALGTDTGGSIRYPSAGCGIVGLKPTHGRVSLRGVFPLSDSHDHIGPMARSVADVARGFAALAGHDPEDPWSRASNPRAAQPSALAPLARGMRLGFDSRYCEEGVEASIAAAFGAMLELWGELGAEVVEIRMPDIVEAMDSWVSISGSELATAHADTFPSRAEEYGDDLRGMLELGQQVDGRQVALAWRARIAFARRLEALFDEVDAMVCPVIPDLFAANTNLMDRQSNPSVAVAGRFTSPFNLSGSPSLTLPCGFDREGAPVGFQIVGPHGEEAQLLGLGTAYEAATDWHTMRPPGLGDALGR